MSHPDIIFLKVHKLCPQGTVESFQLEIDSQSDRVVKRTPITADVSSFYMACIDLNKGYSEENFKFNCRFLQDDETSIRVIKLGGIEDLNPMNYATEISTILNDPSAECKASVTNPIVDVPVPETAIVNNGAAASVSKRESKIPNIPTMIICQNCDTNFPTKYQYQRHQCEFNAEKVILKPNADIKDIDKGLRMKFDCSVCGKQFVSKNNLDRHQSSHDKTNVNICEFCSKQFVSENRLRIHKENHCKKAGDISKFYRSDVYVWKCLKCNQVFPKCHTAVTHASTCVDHACSKQRYSDNINSSVADAAELDLDYDEHAGAAHTLRNEIRTTLAVVAGDMCPSSAGGDADNGEQDTKYVERISTEILLQCEFCNRIYAEKDALVSHQQTHTTAVNYECVTCDATFESYVSAAKHWLTPCNAGSGPETANQQQQQQPQIVDSSNLFYLPKLSLCETCDRTFKSHELLYAHKIKKRHYGVKQYCERTHDVLCNSKEEQPVNKEKIVKLIEDVLLSMNEDAQAANASLESTDPIETEKENIQPEEAATFNSSTSQTIKPLFGTYKQALVLPLDEQIDQNIKLEKHSSAVGSENGEDGTSTIASDDDTSLIMTEDGGKKKRGRKRKISLVGTPSSNVVGRGINKHLAIDSSGSLIDDSVRFQCERCTRVFNNVSVFENHREMDHPANYKCEECNQVVHSAKALLIHSRAHQSLKPYVCEICKRCYSQTSHLWQHMRFHQGIKPFACPHEGCEARYTIRPDLKDHIRKVHTRERPFKCSVCDKCFLTGSVYYQHRLIHTNDRRYGCDICQKRFFRADALNNHRRIHTDERPYGCEVCGRQFRQKGDRNKHLRTQHPAHVLATAVAAGAAGQIDEGPAGGAVEQKSPQKSSSVIQTDTGHFEPQYQVVGSLGMDSSFSVIGM